ncbi:MAG: hypothetical protein JRK53_05795 [Deltaproteobacteria bacterium]|nr:hypothetical protein [Deltaproteobacteria bacterium]
MSRRSGCSNFRMSEDVLNGKNQDMTTPSRDERFLGHIREAVRERRKGSHAIFDFSATVGENYESTRYGRMVTWALRDPFFPLSLFAKHYMGPSAETGLKTAALAQQLALFCRMFIRIRTDIDRYFHNSDVTCIDLDGDGDQDVFRDQWCSLCGVCCQLTGTVPDPPRPVRYPGYWYAWLAGDGPVLQKFCPFLFELPRKALYFCAIHHVKPETCRAYGREDCLKNHPGMARV